MSAELWMFCGVTGKWDSRGQRRGNLVSWTGLTWATTSASFFCAAPAEVLLKTAKICLCGCMSTISSAPLLSCAIPVTPTCAYTVLEVRLDSVHEHHVVRRQPHLCCM